jgi:hypothetical protein
MVCVRDAPPMLRLSMEKVATTWPTTDTVATVPVVMTTEKSEPVE